MNVKQQTIKDKVTISGVGLHTGIETNMTFLPAGTNQGIKFQRTDVDGEPFIDADVDNVVDLSRGTTIGIDGAKIHTVEHTLAAIVGLEIDNVVIQLDGPEPPIMDGSAAMFIDAINEVGVAEQNAERNYFEIPESINYKDSARDVEIAALPLNDYRVTVMVDYNSPVLGSQHATLTDIKNFRKEIASCRTFCFLHELEMLKKQDLIKGGDLNNAIVVVDKVIDDKELEGLAELFNKPKIDVNKEGILNNVELRYKNEPARHKLLDLVGDLALIGRPIKGQVLAARPGHAANIAFAKKVKKIMQEHETTKKNIPVYDPAAIPVLDANEIGRYLPHEYPFRLIDKITYLDEKKVIGVKNVTINEHFFMGHFPENPVFPGVLQIEAMAQTGGILALSKFEDPENYWPYFLGIESCRFKKMVGPGDTIVFKCELLTPIKRGIVKMEGKGFVADKVVCEATMTASIVRKDK